MNAGTIIEHKGNMVVTTTSATTIRNAMSLLIEKQVGSLIVVDENENIVGIITERDIFRLAFQKEGKMMDILVADVMTKDVIIALPEDDINSLQVLITENRIRHLPVMKDGKLIGIISIGDIICEQTNKAKIENRYLRRYIDGAYPR